MNTITIGLIAALFILVIIPALMLYGFCRLGTLPEDEDDKEDSNK